MVDDFAALGVDLERSEDADPVFRVWDINVPSFEAFAALDTQWRIVPITRIEGTRLAHLGLDYAAVDVVLRRRRLPRGVFEDIQVMELATIEARSEVQQ